MRWLSTLVLLLFATPALADITGTARVIDGDTIDIEGERIRLHGIDAPETFQTCLVGHEVWLCGQEATQALENLIGGAPVTCQEQGVDRYGRTIATCRVRGVDIEAWMGLRGSRRPRGYKQTRNSKTIFHTVSLGPEPLQRLCHKDMPVPQAGISKQRRV